ncbi:MAG: hypothetical protein ACKPEQ_27080, partial [Dolichospermum sp.]
METIVLQEIMIHCIHIADKEQMFPFSGHCWVQHDDIILSDEPERCKIFMPVRSYDNRKINF